LTTGNADPGGLKIKVSNGCQALRRINPVWYRRAINSRDDDETRLKNELMLLSRKAVKLGSAPKPPPILTIL